MNNKQAICITTTLIGWLIASPAFSQVSCRNPTVYVPEGSCDVRVEVGLIVQFDPGQYDCVVTNAPPGYPFLSPGPGPTNVEVVCLAGDEISRLSCSVTVIDDNPPVLSCPDVSVAGGETLGDRPPETFPPPICGDLVYTECTLAGGSVWADASSNIQPSADTTYTCVASRLGGNLPTAECTGNIYIEAAVAIDIKPGSDPNCFNINGHGVIPVAILGNAQFDVTNIDVDTLVFDGLTVRVRGKKGPLCSIEDVNGDVFPDLVCHFEDDASSWTEGSASATLTGRLLDNTPFEGTDSICIVP